MRSPPGACKPRWGSEALANAAASLRYAVNAVTGRRPVAGTAPGDVAGQPVRQVGNSADQWHAERRDQADEGLRGPEREDHYGEEWQEDRRGY